MKLHLAPRKAGRQSGVTLIELMVALTIGMIIIAGIGYIYLNAARVFRSLEASGRVQENVRYAFERISHDVRMAGFTGCSYQTTVNVLNGNTAWQHNLFGRPLAGYEEDVSAFPAELGTNRLRGDAFTLLRADNASQYVVRAYNKNAAEFDLTNTHNLKPGQILVATDCDKAAVFQMTGPTNNNNTVSNVVHNTGNSTSPGNSTKNLGFDDCDSNPNNSTPDCKIKLLSLSSVTYYIRTNASGEPALYREALGTAGGNAAVTAEEVVEGIENMQIVYGVDTSGTADGAVDVYTTADDVTAQAPGANDDEKWKRVLAIRISLVAVSTANQAVNSQIVPYKYNGSTVTPTDKRMRKVFTTTIAIRNRL